MGWVMHRSAVITVSVITAAVLFGLLNGFGFNVNDSIMNTGIGVATILALGQLYIAFAIWKRYM